MSTGAQVGLEFGQSLGLRRALRGLPLSPLVPGYGHLVAGQQALGLRHIGDALVERGRVLRVLDGVFEERAARRWQHIGAGRIQEIAVVRGVAYGPLLAQLEAVQLQDPAALRRILLYQLTGLLQAHPQGSEPGAAVALGVCPREARALVRAAAGHPRLDGQQREAAEGLEDAWSSGKVRRAARLAARLPADGGGDALLRGRLSDIALRAKEADRALDAGQKAERSGDVRAAQAGFLRAARLAADCPRAVLALVRVRRAEDGSAGPADALAVRPAATTVSLSAALPAADGHPTGGSSG
ncbi:hypothetical protein EQG64_28800 [Streptomyces sp. S6]|nr:hypothetical protein EQG64_28800 [Streptomyces sp. S6]